MKMGQETVDGSVTKLSMEQKLGCSPNDDEGFSETVIAIPEKLPDLSSSGSVEATGVVRDSENRSTDSGESCATANVIGEKVAESKDEMKSWVIDVQCDDEEILEGEKVCRICHLSSEQPLKLASSRAKTDLIGLGCGCKGELSVVHSYCAEAWFKLKGNRTCEICGKTVDNVRGLGNETFMEEWKESRLNGIVPESSERSEGDGHWQGQPLCNFLMACLVIAFILPWFFRINFW